MPNSRKTTNQEEIKMRKLIVEAPELKEGQSDSSGGIRENGKMSVQYKNPVPYVEPTIPPAVPQKTYTQKDRLKEQTKDFVFDVSIDILSMLWHEYGRPLLQAKLHQLVQNSITCLESPAKKTQTIATHKTKTSQIIDAEYIEIREADSLDNNDNIIRFPKQQVS